MKSAQAAGDKGGGGKTHILSHMSWRARDKGRRVLVMDTDHQRNGIYRRLGQMEYTPAVKPDLKWAPGCLCIHSPYEWHFPEHADSNFDLVFVDTHPDPVLPPGPPVDMLIVPIDGPDAAAGANEMVASALERGIKKIVLVRNGLEEGGVRFQREFDGLCEDSPSYVKVCPIDIPRAPSSKRSSLTCLPAWSDAYKSKDIRLLIEATDWLLAELEAT